MIHAKHSPLRLPLTPAFKSLWGAQVLLGFMGTLFLLLALALGDRADIWLNSIDNHVIFELPESPSQDLDLIDRVQRESAFRDSIKAIDGLNDVTLLKRTDIEARLSGWIDDLSSLPLPIMVEAKAKEDFRVKNATQNLATEFPTHVIHEGRIAMKDGLQQILLLKNFSYVMVMIVILVGMAMSLTAAYWRLDVQSDVIDLLHSMGASRRFIIIDLARSNFLQTLASSAVGLGLALFVLAMLWLFSGGGDAQSISLLSHNYSLIALCVPLILACIAGMATSWAVNMRYTAFLKYTE